MNNLPIFCKELNWQMTEPLRSTTMLATEWKNRIDGTPLILFSNRNRFCLT